MAVAVILASLRTNPATGQSANDEGWRSDWAVAEGYSLSIDTEGYQFPSALAFVPRPGPSPKDPLYFVLELRGRIKVVTNDRTTHTFAEDFVQVNPKRELPALEGEVGLAGICLAPAQGYVFVTFAYQDAAGILRNNIVRFESVPETFSLEPRGQTELGDIFADYEAVPSHQIGSCQVSDNRLYVSVADARQTAQSQQIDSLLGKVLSMTLDGEPAPGNPFFDNGQPQAAAGYVWAYGFRNPFGLQAVDGRLFVADNGSGLDRFLEVEPGTNYLWDGTDWSIGTNANLVISPAVGPAQVAYTQGGGAGFHPETPPLFFIALSAAARAGILQVQYSLEKSQVTERARYLVRYQGDQTQYVVGVAVGPDGLYFTPILPDARGRSAVFRLAYNLQQEHPYLLTADLAPEELIAEKGCLGCHALGGEGGSAGPALDRAALVPGALDRLHSAEYLASLVELDQLDREPLTSYRNARAEVAASEGTERLRIWMTYHIMEPRFDKPDSSMPNLGLSKTEARSIADYLLREESFTDRAKASVLAFLPRTLLPRHLLLAFAVGLLAALALAAFVALGVRLRRRRATARA
jgi:hypothetical protein